MVVTIDLPGGVRLDTDKGTRVGFKYEGGVMGMPQGGASRSYDLSVPATDANCAAFGLPQMPEAEGMRQSVRARLACGGAVMEGRVYLKRWAGRRLELLFVYNAADAVAGWRLDEPVGHLIQADVQITIHKGDELDTGVIRPFGFYGYGNMLTHLYSPSIGDQVTSMPSTNLRWLVEQAAATLNLGVAWNNSGSPYEQPENYGILLPTANAIAWNTYSVTGSGVGGYTPANISPHLHLATRRLKRGMVPANKTVYAYEALQPCEVAIDSVGDNYVIDGDVESGRNVLAEPGQAFRRRLDTGDSFVIVAKGDRRYLGALWWWASNAYEASIDPITVRVGDTGTTTGPGGTVSLRDNLPDLTLRQLLDTYCLLACASWYPNTAGTGIEVTTYGYRVADQTLYADLDGMRVTGVGDIHHYIDGYADSNLVTCAGIGEEDLNPLLHFRRDYRQDNDLLERESSFGEVPLWDGYAIDECGDGMPMAYFDDAHTGESQQVVLTPRLGIFFANLGGACHPLALHISVIDTLGGVGAGLKNLFAQGVTAKVGIAASLVWFCGLRPVSVVRWRGRDWLVREAVWGDGIAELTLLRLPV